MTRHRAVERSDVVRARRPLVHEAMPFIAHAAIRTRGTIGGSLAHADPAAELPAVMLALDATIRRSQQPRGSREFRRREFFTGLFSTALEPGELLTEIAIPARCRPRVAARRSRSSPGGTATSRWRASPRVVTLRRARAAARPRASRCSASAIGRCSPSSGCAHARGPGADRPRRFAPPPTPPRADDIDPTSDIHASSRYRRHLARVLTRARRCEQRASLDARAHVRTSWRQFDMKIYDLSQPLNEQVSFWPYYPPFEVKYIKRKAEHGVNAQYIQTSNHMGTHLDAPRHFVTAGMTIDEIPVEWLCGPGVIVDLSDEMDELAIYTPKMIEDRVEVRKGDLLFLHTGWDKHAQFGAEPDEEKYIHRHPGAHPDMVPWLLEKEIHIWGVDCISTDHPMNLPIGRFLGKGMHGHCDRVRKQCEDKFGGPEGVAKLFPDSAYQLTHNALFPKNCMHIENLGGDIDAPELQNKRLILGCFPWKFKGGEAAFCRAVAFTGDWKP